MNESAAAGTQAGFEDTIGRTFTRSRARIAAVVMAGVFAIGLLVGLAASSLVGSAGGPAPLSAADRQVAAQARLAWLQGEHDSYGATGQLAAQAHLTWLQGEHDSYGSSTSLQRWTDYRQFRLSEEGYVQ